MTILRHTRQTIILTSILLGMSGAIALASPDAPQAGRSVVQLIQH